jgi:hypothetical protein
MGRFLARMCRRISTPLPSGRLKSSITQHGPSPSFSKASLNVRAHSVGYHPPVRRSLFNLLSALSLLLCVSAAVLWVRSYVTYDWLQVEHGPAGLGRVPAAMSMPASVAECRRLAGGELMAVCPRASSMSDERWDCSGREPVEAPAQ